MTTLIFFATIFFTTIFFIFKAINDKLKMVEKEMREMSNMVHEIEEITRRLDHLEHLLDVAVIQLENRHITRNPCNEIILNEEEKILNNPIDFFDMREAETALIK